MPRPIPEFKYGYYVDGRMFESLAEADSFIDEQYVALQLDACDGNYVFNLQKFKDLLQKDLDLRNALIAFVKEQENVQRLKEAEEAKLLNEQKVREDNTVSDDDLPF